MGLGALTPGREKKKKPLIVATYVLAAAQGQPLHSARTNSLPLSGQIWPSVGAGEGGIPEFLKS